jgi:hypothetical protein
MKKFFALLAVAVIVVTVYLMFYFGSMFAVEGSAGIRVGNHVYILEGSCNLGAKYKDLTPIPLEI